MNALIFGVGGQDGSYMAQLLKSKGYVVYGTTRRSSVDNLARVVTGTVDVMLEADLTDAASVTRIVSIIKPDEIYNLADQDLVSSSFETPRYSVDVTAGGVANILDAVMKHSIKSKVFQPGSSTVFGGRHNHYCTEDTPFSPESPYACAKVHALMLAKMYRKKYGMHVSTAILYGHNSERQKCDYLLHRFARHAVLMSRDSLHDSLTVTDPGYKIDVGYAPEFVEGMYRLMQLSSPADVILSTGNPLRVGDLASQAMYEAGVEGKAVTEIVVNKEFNECVTSAVPSKAFDLFAWKAKSNASDVVEKLVEHYRKVLK